MLNDKRIDFLSVARVLNLKFQNRYGQFLQCLGIDAPFHWEAGLEGVKGWKLQAPNAVAETCLSDLIEVSGTHDVGQNPGGRCAPFDDECFRNADATPCCD